MEHGTISAELPKRLIAVWEDSLAEVSASHGAAERMARRLGRNARAVRYWHEKDLARGRLWLATSRYGVRVEVATFLGDGFAEALEHHLDREGWPVHAVVAYEAPGALGRSLAGRPDVVSVYDLDSRRALHWGSRAGSI